MRQKIARSVLVGLGSLALTLLAHAEAPAANTAAATAATEEVTVTGSRVITNGNDSPTPVTVVQEQELMQLQPTTINDALNYLPVFQGSRGQFSQPNTTGLFGGGNPATTELNLRNLGAQRTLILFDGQRVAPTNALGIVDVDMIPQELIQRVDVVTGGVSAVYGSDAVAGVVNYITDKNFNGFKAEANYGVSSRHDDNTWKAGFAAGMPLFSGNGHVEVSYDHYGTDGLPHRNMRNYYLYGLEGATPGSTASQGSVANPYALFNNVHNAQNSFGGLITNGALKGQQFASNNVLQSFNHGTLTGAANIEIGGDGSIGGFNSLAAPVRFDQLFARFDYSLTDTTHFHTEATGNWKDDTTYSNPQAFNSQTFSTSNAFLPANYKTAMGTATTFTMAKSYLEIPLLTQISHVTNFFINSGLDGKIGGYTWGADVNYSNNKINDVFENNINNQRLSAALDAVTNPAGQVVCNASLSNTAYSNCVPFNAFGPNAASDSAIAYVTDTTHVVPKFTQIEASGHVDGAVFDLPAGPVNGSVSVEWRRQTFSQDSDTLPTSVASCDVGLRYNCSPTMVLHNTAFAIGPSNSQSVKEGALEFDAPLLKNVAAIQSFNLNGAVRYTSYDVGGNAWTWKVGIDWHISDSVRIRATESRDIEAPTLGMVFQPLLVTTGGTTLDLLTNQNVPAFTDNVGNTNLVSEVGHTKTAGVVWTPQSLPGFSVSLDGYYIIIDGALTQIQGQANNIQQLCYTGSSAYCSLQVRPGYPSGGFGPMTYAGCFDPTNPACIAPGNSASGYWDVFENAAVLKTYGADLELNYATRVFSRPFSARLLTNWQPHYLYAPPGAPTADFSGVTYPNLVPLQAVPAWQATALLNYAVTDRLEVGVSERWRQGMQLEPDVQAGIFPSGAPAYYTTNLNVGYRFDEAGSEIYLNIRNVFDKLPTPVVGLSGGSGFALTDDPVGRYYTVGFRYRR
jgi:outer membrane receptor protein involved in Fe transport